MDGYRGFLSGSIRALQLEVVATSASEEQGYHRAHRDICPLWTTCMGISRLDNRQKALGLKTLIINHSNHNRLRNEAVLN